MDQQLNALVKEKGEGRKKKKIKNDELTEEKAIKQFIE